MTASERMRSTQAWTAGASARRSTTRSPTPAEDGDIASDPTHGWESLTPTELQVVELVASGLTNPQIGERLFISKRTVQTHVAHVFTKLGVSTRAALAADAAGRDQSRQEPIARA